MDQVCRHADRAGVSDTSRRTAPVRTLGEAVGPGPIRDPYARGLVKKASQAYVSSGKSSIFTIFPSCTV